MNYRLKQFVAIALIAVLVLTGIPMYPGNENIWTEKAFASTNMRVEPSEINIDKGDKTTILFSFNAADEGQSEHDTVIMVCTPQANGAPPIPGSVIMQGSFKTKENDHYITHKVEWDGTINGQPLPEGRYTLCVAPASYTGNGVYYGQMASFEIVGSDRPSEPADISVKPAAQGKVLVSGTAQAGTSVEIELSETGSDEVRRAGSVQVSSRGVWSIELNLSANRLTHIAARTLLDSQASSYGQIVSVMPYSLPAFSVSWETVAAYFYKIDNTSELVETARQIAEWNNISYDICRTTGCPETITGVASLILINPEMESVPAQADLALFRAEAISKRLRIVNPAGIAPVDPARGDFVYSAPTLRLQALMPLSFDLRYMSRQAEEGAHGLGWRHAYEWSLTPVDGKMELVEPDGSRYEFIPLASGAYMTPRGTNWRLERAGGVYSLHALDGTQYRFNAQGGLQSIEDTNGNRVEFDYASGLLQTIATNGAALSLSYNEQDRLTAVSDHSGRQLRYVYDTAGNLVEIVDADGGSTTLAYDDEHHVIAVTNPTGDGTISVFYDDEQRVIALTDEYGGQSQLAYEGKVAPVVRGEDDEDAVGGGTGIHPDYARDIPESDEVILSGTMHNMANAPAYRKVEGLQPIIADYIQQQSDRVQQQITTFNASAIACGSCGVEEVLTAIQGSNANPVVIKAGQLNLENSVTFGNASKPVVLIADGINTNRDITVEVYGTLIVNNGMNANTKLKLIANDVAGSYGSIYSNGRIHLNDDSAVTVADGLYTAGLTYNSGLLEISAKRVVVTGELHINTRVQMNIADEMSLGGLVSNNELAELTMTGGDLFVRDHVHVNNQLSIATGGLFAIGGDMIPNRRPVIRIGVGEGKTILRYDDSGQAKEADSYVEQSMSAWSVQQFSLASAPAGQTVLTDALGRKTEYAWSNRFLLQSRKLPSGDEVNFAYDSGNRLQMVQDASENINRMKYDARGNLLQAIGGRGHSIVYRYNAMNRIAAVVDSKGNQETYQHDAAGNVIAYTNALGKVTTMERDIFGEPVRIVDAIGSVTAIVNDSFGFPTAVTNPAGYETAVTRDALHRVTRMDDGLGTVRQYGYDAKDRLTTVIDALGQQTSMAYDLNGNVKSATDEAGGLRTMTYEVERLKRVTNPLGDYVSYTYDLAGNVTQQTDENGAVTTYVYDEMDRIVSEIDPLANEVSYAYDPSGNLIAYTDATGGTTRYTYNNDYQVLTMTDPLDAVTVNKYDSEGQLIKTTNALGNSTWYTYNAAGQLTIVTDALGGETQYGYDENGRLTSTRTPDGSIWQSKYDSRGLSTGMIDPLRNETTIVRDLLGHMTSFTDAEGHETRYEYDALGRQTKMINALGYATSYAYNPLGQVTSITDANGNETAFDYDAAGRLIEVTNAKGDKTTYQYNGTGQLTAQLNALGHTTQYLYNSAGQFEQRINPLGETKTYTYDGNGNLLKSTEHDGTSTTYSYDAAGRVLSVAYSDGASVRYTYDLLGRRLEMNDSTGQTRYTSDALNRPTEIIDASGNNIRYEWDSMGNRSRIVYPDNSSVWYSYDALGRIAQVRDAQQQVTAYDYDKNSRLKEKTLPSGAQSLYHYDALGQLLELQHLGDGGESVESLSYTYDPAGNILSAHRQESGSDEDNPLGAMQPEDVVLYAYDALNQLIQAQQIGGATTSYSYDVFGNRLQKSVLDGVNSYTEHYTYDAANKLTYWEKGSDYRSYSYDLRGNLLRVQGQSANEILEQYEWNAANRLARHSNTAGDVTVYHYDGDHNRVYMGMELGSRETASTYPSGHPLGQQIGWEPQNKKERFDIYFANDTTMPYAEPLMAASEDGDWSQCYVYGAMNERISMSYLPSGDVNNDWEPVHGVSGTNSGEAYSTLYYLSDVRGSAIGLMDEQGGIAARYHYDEFGVALDSEKHDLNWPGPDNLFGYTGLGYDYTSGLNYARARYFDAGVGRFVSEDTYQGTPENPLSLNLYTYVQNNPIKYIDPTGFAPHSRENVMLHAVVDFHPVSNTSIWTKIGDYVYRIADGYTEGALSDYVDIALTKPYSVEQLLSAGWLVVSVVPFSKAEVTATNLTSNVIQKSGKWFKVNKTKIVCNCFTAGTTVLTNEGEKNIEDIEVGDRVLAKDENNPDGELAYKEVTALYTNYRNDIIKLYVGDLLVETTDNHPFWVEGKGWVFADELNVGDKLQKADGSNLSIDKVEFVLLDEPVMVYNFTVADFHTYYVTDLGIWVHNTNCFNQFRSFDYHYEKHVLGKHGGKKEFGNITKEQYFEQAFNLALKDADGKTIFRKALSNGRMATYNKNTNELVILHDGVEIGTYFKPNRGIDYFNDLK